MSNASPTSTELTILDAPLETLEVHPVAMRDRDDQEELAALAKSLAEDTQLQACVARPLPRGRYQLVYGSRRYKAAKFAGLATLRIDVRELTDRQALELIGKENMMRRDFDPIQRADYVAILLMPESQGGAGMTVGEIGERFGKSDSWVKNSRRLARLPDFWRDKVSSGDMPERSARVLVPHLGKEPVMRAIEESYKRDPAAWQSQEVVAAHVRFVVEQFEKLEQAASGAAGGPTGRMVESNREVASEGKGSKNDPYISERLDRQTDRLTEKLEEWTSGWVSIDEPLTAKGAEALLGVFWNCQESLEVIVDAALARIRKLEDGKE